MGYHLRCPHSLVVALHTNDHTSKLCFGEAVLCLVAQGHLEPLNQWSTDISLTSFVMSAIWSLLSLEHDGIQALCLLFLISFFHSPVKKICAFSFLSTIYCVISTYAKVIHHPSHLTAQCWAYEDEYHVMPLSQRHLSILPSWLLDFLYYLSATAWHTDVQQSQKNPKTINNLTVRALCVNMYLIKLAAWIREIHTFFSLHYDDKFR